MYDIGRYYSHILLEMSCRMQGFNGPWVKTKLVHSLSSYVNDDEDLAVCRDVHDSSWESTFFATLDQQEDKEIQVDEVRDVEQENAVDNESPMKVKSYKDANELLEGVHTVQHFVEAKWHIREVLAIGSIVDNVSGFQLAATRQTTLDSCNFLAQQCKPVTTDYQLTKSFRGFQVHCVKFIHGLCNHTVLLLSGQHSVCKSNSQTP